MRKLRMPAVNGSRIASLRCVKSYELLSDFVRRKWELVGQAFLPVPCFGNRLHLGTAPKHLPLGFCLPRNQGWRRRNKGLPRRNKGSSGRHTTPCCREAAN